MSEQVKVFTNVNNQTAAGAAHSVTLASTGSTERAVIKSVECKNVGVATLDLDGRTVATSTGDMIASGSLIMDVSSVLSLKFPFLSAYIAPSFKGMFFSNGTDTINYFEGDGIGSGTSTSMTSITNNSTSSNANANSSFAAYKNGVLTFFRYYNSNIFEYISTSSSPVLTYSFGSGNGSCTDGTYMYNIPSASTTTVNRRHIETGALTNFTTASTVVGQGANQGSFLLHHDGYLYSKGQGGEATMYIVKISDGSVTTVSNATLPGSYSDGACIVTTVAGKSYVVEQGTGGWIWYEIGGSSTQFTQASGSSGASTEYGDGGVEVAPGIAVIFGEESDDISIIDMNTSPPSWSHISSGIARKFSVNDAFNSYMSACGLLVREVQSGTKIYDAYTSGILITEET